ncbi:condensation domain-containing protein [Corynebacterium kroppenstedtii]|uniref:condensation domain-containing protein n=1 Tax=Corynebacterium kroppenstedtii TaxID=161879 RepID=UPI003873A91A
MEYTELADYPLPTGHLSTWHFIDDASQWSEDERSLSINHEDHLREVLRAEKDNAEHGLPSVSEDWIGGAFVIHQPLNADALRQALMTWFSRHEAYRTTAVADDRNEATTSFTRYTLGSSAVDVSRNDFGVYADDQLLRHEIHRHFAQHVNGIGWPHVAVATIEPEAAEAAQVDDDDREHAPQEFTVIFAADHAVMDAYTQLFTIAELRELYSAAVDKREPALPPAGSYVDFCSGERAVTESASARERAVKDWKEFLTDADEHPAQPVFPLPIRSAESGSATPADQHRAQHSLSQWLLDEKDISRLGKQAKANGGSTKSALLTALKLALTELSPVSSARYIMPMHTRHEPKYMLSAGWFVGLMPVDDPLNGARSFTEAFSDTVQATKRHRDLSVYPYAAVSDALHINEPPRFVISYVDTRFVPGADAWGDRDRVLRSSVTSDGDVYIWLNRTGEGLNVSMRYPNNAQAEESISAFLSRFAAIIHSVISTGDYATAVPVRA